MYQVDIPPIQPLEATASPWPASAADFEARAWAQAVAFAEKANDKWDRADAGRGASVPCIAKPTHALVEALRASPVPMRRSSLLWVLAEAEMWFRAGRSVEKVRGHPRGRRLGPLPLLQGSDVDNQHRTRPPCCDCAWRENAKGSRSSGRQSCQPATVLAIGTKRADVYPNRASRPAEAATVRVRERSMPTKDPPSSSSKAQSQRLKLSCVPPKTL